LLFTQKLVVMHTQKPKDVLIIAPRQILAPYVLLPLSALLSKLDSNSEAFQIQLNVTRRTHGYVAKLFRQILTIRLPIILRE
jgi:hypothetical protein